MCFERKTSNESLIDFINQIISVTNITEEEILTDGAIDLVKLITLVKEKGIIDSNQLSALSNLIQEKKEQVSN
ncbi:hypothetical protein HF072_00665 [Bacillus sp. RO3]|nr:hypothetical protein [Bacillus sp. RO3]